MKQHLFRLRKTGWPAVGAMLMPLAAFAQSPTSLPVGGVEPPALPVAFSWATVVNNGDLLPGSEKVFNSYNQPSVTSPAWWCFALAARVGTAASRY